MPAAPRSTTTTSPAPTRERLIQAARRLFQEQGYAGTGVSTILREAGVNSGSLYHHFPSKEALLEAVLEWYLENLDPVIMAPQRARTADPLERVFTLLAWYRSWLIEHEFTLGCPVGNLALECSDHLPRVRELIERNFQSWSGEIERWLVDAGDALPDGTNRKALATFVLTVMEGALMQARAQKSIEPFDASVAVLRDHLDQLRR